jgi:hypothetical protein
LLGDGNNGIEVVYCEEKKSFVLGQQEQQGRIKKSIVVQARQAQQTYQGSTSLVSLVLT